MTRGHVIGIDQGTSGTKAVLLDGDGRVLAESGRAMALSHPRPGWVEQDPEAMVANVLGCARELLDTAGIPASSVAGLGIDNHTESLVLWEKRSGRPVHPAIIWQCRRSTGETDGIDSPKNRSLIRRRTGLDLDPTFTATKLRWIASHRPDIADALAAGDVLWGTVDTWLLWRLTGGAAYATDYSNASRTMLLDIGALDWDAGLADLFGLDLAAMPQLLPSGGRFGECLEEHFGTVLPVTAMLGDQQASLFGHGCLKRGDLKSTYGTGAFVWMNTGEDFAHVESAGCLQTVAWHLDRPAYALEGFVMYAGAILDWLVDHLRLCADAGDVIRRARRAGAGSTVILVPAFQGLASPWWDPQARAAVLGLESSSGDSEVCQAALEAVCFQVRRVLDDMAGAHAFPDSAVRADGGLAQSDHFLQLQADILGLPVRRSGIRHLTAYGSALMAGIGAGLWDGTGDLRRPRDDGTTFTPDRSRKAFWDDRYRTWCHAVERSLNGA